MNAVFKGDVHLQNDDSSNSEDEDVEVDNFEEEAVVEDAIPEEPCIERAVEDYDDHDTQCDIALTYTYTLSCCSHA